MMFKSFARKMIERRGYYLRHRSMLPFGIDYMLDIERLCRAWNLDVLTFFDIGAHRGETCTIALERFRNATVFAFEPSTDTFRKLIQISDDPRFRPFRTALGERSGDVQFFEYELSNFNSMVPNPPDQLEVSKTSRPTTVPCTTVDEFCKEHEIHKIDVLKIDAERCDLIVLRGAREMLSVKRVQFVYFEFNTVASEGTGAFAPIAEFLCSFGFRFVASYIDRFETASTFLVANALFVIPPRALGQTKPIKEETAERLCPAKVQSGRTSLDKFRGVVGRIGWAEGITEMNAAE
jgi:FkbM family methyltransferase